MSGTNNTVNPIQNEEIALTNGYLTLYISPLGASLRGLVVENNTQIITRYVGTEKVGGQGDVLIPFPGRVRGGKYFFEGSEFQMHKNDGEGPNAIHGFLRTRAWSTIAHTDVAVTFATDLTESDAPGYPFPLHVEVSYELYSSGLKVSYIITNTGTTDAPVAAGFHPYFSLSEGLIDGSALTVPFKSFLEFDEGLLPTGEAIPVGQTPYNFLNERVIGPTKFNHCYIDPNRDDDGNVAVILRSSDGYRSIKVIFGPEINYVVLYSGDPLPEAHRRKSLAIEPMTCGSDALNHPEWGLATIKPGEALSGSWSVVYQTT